MANRNTRLALYLAKIETVEGTDSVPVAATDAIEIDAPFEPDYDNAFKPEALDRVRGPVLDPGDPMTVAGKVFSQSRKAYFRGTATAIATGNKAELDPWFRAAGYAATYVATPGSETCTYTPAQSGLETITEYYYRDGILYKHTGVRGEMKVSFGVGSPVAIEFAASGRVTGDSDLAVPTTAAFKTLDWPIATDATIFTINGFTAGCIRSWEHSLGNDIQRRDCVKGTGGIAGWRVAKRNPTFKVTLEEDLHATVDWTTLRDNKTSFAISWLIGGTQYNKLQFDAARAFIRKITPSNDNGLALVTLEGDLRGTAAGGGNTHTLLIK